MDIEKDPIDQGFDSHGYDLLIASNVLHATRYLEETLGHCRDLLAPSGQLIALENLSGLGRMDLTFGQLMAGGGLPTTTVRITPWRVPRCGAGSRQRGFRGGGSSGPDASDASRTPDKGVIVAQGPAAVMEPAGAWVLAADQGGLAAKLATDWRRETRR